jgi:hypothetical protein
MEIAMKRAPRKISDTRELTDKELNAITRAMGDGVRTQTITVSSIIQANLKAEFAASRKKAPRVIKARKPLAA